MAIIPIDSIQRRNATYDKFFQETNISRTADGSVAKSVLDAVFSELEAIENRSEEVRSDLNPLTANGPYLELWSEFLGIERRLALRAFALDSDRIVKMFVDTGTFGDLNNGADLVIDRNSISFTGNAKMITDIGFEEYSVEYELIENTIILPASESELYISVVASQYGTEHNIGKNQLVGHSFSNYPAYPNTILQVTNTAPILNGVDEEDDDSIRYRISRASYTRTNSTIQKLNNVVNLIPGIRDVVIIEGYSGYGTLDLFIDANTFTIPDSLIEDAMRKVIEINYEGLEVFMNKSPRIGISIELSVKFKNNILEDDKNNILIAIESEILNSLIDLNVGEGINFASLYDNLNGSYIEIQQLGIKNEGFDSIIIYRPGLGNRRSATVLENTTIEFTPNNIERILPEDSLARPVLVKEFK